MLVIVPVGLILWRTFAGRRCFLLVDHDPGGGVGVAVVALVVAIVVPLNVVFGVPTALVWRKWVLGKSVLQAVIDLPFVSPVVVGVP